MRIGMDAGGSLIKIVYFENNRIHFKKFPIYDLDQAIFWLKMIAPTAVIALTGGKAEFIQKKHLPTSIIIPEFQATVEGAQFFLSEENKKIEDGYILVNIGTGTSWHIVKNEQYKRILGSGIGGGTFIGLGSLLTTGADYNQLSTLAENGDKGNVDMLVKDIYDSSEAPINGELTAANFAKGKVEKQTEADRMASLSNMIAETIVLLTSQAAALHQVQNVVMIGTALVGNPSLSKSLIFYLDMLGLSSLFLTHGEYCGAIGAYLNV